MNGSPESHEDSPLPAKLSGVLLKSVEEILHEPIAKEEMARALDRARQIAGSTSSDCAATPMRRKVRLLRRLLTAAAATAAVVVAVLLLSSERNSASAAWAKVVEAVAKKPWLHYMATYQDGTKMEAWFSARQAVVTGRMIKIGSKMSIGNDREARFVIDMSQNTRDWYDREKNLIVRTTDEPFREGADPSEAIFSAFLSGNLGQTIDAGRFRLVPERQRVVVEGGKRWIEHRLILRGKNENATYQHEWIVSVDPDTQLPFRWEQVARLTSDPSKVDVGSRHEIDYPATGPEDMYALGVPKTAKIIDRTLRSDVERLAKETAAPRHWADDKFSALVIESGWEMKQWWQGQSIYRVWKDGLRWRVDHSMGPVTEPYDKPPPKDTNPTEWWRIKAKKFPFRPETLCDGNSYWSYDTKTRRPTPADTAAGWPENTMVIVSTEKHRRPSFPVARDHFMVGYPLGRWRPTDPLNDLQVLPGIEASVDRKPKSGPPNTVLLEVRNPNWKLQGSSEFSELRRNPQIWRFWIDPKRDYLVMRREELVTRERKELLTNGFAIEATVQDPRGRWYPTVVRRFKCNTMIGTDKWGDGILRFYYDFKTPIPDSVFKAD